MRLTLHAERLESFLFPGILRAEDIVRTDKRRDADPCVAFVFPQHVEAIHGRELRCIERREVGSRRRDGSGEFGCGNVQVERGEGVRRAVAPEGTDRVDEVFREPWVLRSVSG